MSIEPHLTNLNALNGLDSSRLVYKMPTPLKQRVAATAKSESGTSLSNLTFKLNSSHLQPIANGFKVTVPIQLVVTGTASFASDTSLYQPDSMGWSYGGLLNACTSISIDAGGINVVNRTNPYTYFAALISHQDTKDSNLSNCKLYPDRYPENDSNVDEVDSPFANATGDNYPSRKFHNIVSDTKTDNATSNANCTFTVREFMDVPILSSFIAKSANSKCFAMESEIRVSMNFDSSLLMKVFSKTKVLALSRVVTSVAVTAYDVPFISYEKLNLNSIMTEKISPIQVRPVDDITMATGPWTQINAGVTTNLQSSQLAPGFLPRYLLFWAEIDAYRALNSSSHRDGLNTTAVCNNNLTFGVPRANLTITVNGIPTSFSSADQIWRLRNLMHDNDKSNVLDFNQAYYKSGYSVLVDLAQLGTNDNFIGSPTQNVITVSCDIYNPIAAAYGDNGNSYFRLNTLAISEGYYVNEGSSGRIARTVAMNKDIERTLIQQMISNVEYTASIGDFIGASLGSGPDYNTGAGFFDFLKSAGKAVFNGVKSVVSEVAPAVIPIVANVALSKLSGGQNSGGAFNSGGYSSGGYSSGGNFNTGGEYVSHVMPNENSNVSRRIKYVKGGALNKDSHKQYQ